jgi:tRNA A-37 threonylcarbamoyl transferase component Bud32
MLRIAPAYRSSFEQLGLTYLESIVAFFAGNSAGRGVSVRPFQLPIPGQPPLSIFYKQYEYRPAAWSFWGRASKARCEYENYAVFRSLNIPCAEPVAIGEQRDGLGRLRRAFIITRAIPEARTLLDFARQKTDSGRAVLRQQLAAFTRRIHRAGFFHNDLYLRNLLVTTESAEPKLWWIDCPRGSFAHWLPWRRRRRLKDLACLDKAASQLCSKAERVAFIREYAGERRLSATAKRLIQDVQAYRRMRWPEDWRGA